VLRRILLGCLLALLLPSILAAGFGVWTTAGAWQQHLALDLLLELLLWMEHFEPRTSLITDGLIGTWEIPLLLGSVALVIGTARWWEKPLPAPLLRLVDLPEMGLACLGLVAGGAVLAIGASVDRLLFWGGLTLAVIVGRTVAGPVTPSPEEGGWRARSNRTVRLTVAVLSIGVLFYGVTSLWEGATWRNPVFRISDLWIAGPGRVAPISGGIWLALGMGVAGYSWKRRPRRLASADFVGPRWLPSVLVAGVALVPIVEAIRAPSAKVGAASAISAAGLLGLAAALGPFVMGRRFPKRHDATVLDPRQIASVMLPIAAWGALCLLRGFTVQLWTPSEAIEGIEELAGERCVFSLSLDRSSGDVFFTDRCATSAGRISADGEVERWDLQARGVSHVEELGGPDEAGVLWAASQAYVADANLVLLAIEGALGPRTLPDPSGHPRETTDADAERSALAAYVPMPSCWVSSWVPVPGTDEVLLGCENRSGVELLQPGQRRVVGQRELSSRLETGAFSPDGDRLYGVSLWADPRLRAWAWPSGEEVARRVVGPFNWTVTSVPEPETLWVSRFIEGTVLVLDPESLAVADRIRLSFGVRAMIHEPVNDLVWAAGAYSGRLWAIEARPPHRKKAFPICGETRDLVADEQGRVIASSDCGVFRFDPQVLWPR
jgi:hypothetical protein